MVDWAEEQGIKYLIAYIFSIENMNRSKEEVSYLMDLAAKVFLDDTPQFKEKNRKIRIAGDLTLASEKIQKIAKNAEKETEHCTGTELVLAFYYGGRQEILSACNQISKDIIDGKIIPPINNEIIKQYLWTKDIPDPDCIIRTSGEFRLSNFLTWQGVYSELFFPKFYFPDFTKESFLEILEEYSNRKRRFGK